MVLGHISYIFVVGSDCSNVRGFNRGKKLSPSIHSIAEYKTLVASCVGIAVEPGIGIHSEIELLDRQ
jgi:hypothetical protein